MRLVSVAVPVPCSGRSRTRCPTDVAVPPVGARVLVPLGKRIDDRLRARHGRWRRRPRTSARSDADQGRRRRPGRSSRSCRPTSWRLRRGSRTTTRAASAKRSPRRCRRARGSRANATRRSPKPAAARISGERGAAAHGAGAARRQARRSASSSIDAAGRGVHAALVTLERDGLVTLTQPLKGQASAYRTVRVATLTAQGHDIAGSTTNRPAAGRLRPAEAPASSSASASAPRSTCCKARPTASTPSELRRDGIGAQTLARLARPRPRRVLAAARRARSVRASPPLASSSVAAVVLTGEQASGARRGLTTLARGANVSAGRCCTA